MAQLIQVKSEPNPYNEDGAAVIAYFKGTPTQDDLMAAFRVRYITISISPISMDYQPAQFQDAVADAGGLERWYLCQDC